MRQDNRALAVTMIVMVVVVIAGLMLLSGQL